MAINYTNRLERLKKRRFDPYLNESLLTKAFSTSVVPENVKYLAESMQPMDAASNRRTLEASENVRNHLERGLNVSFSKTYRHQGSVMVNTNIQVSDIDQLVIIDSYSFLPTGQDVSSPYVGDPDKDIVELRRQSIEVLKRQYDIVNDDGSKSISIYNKNLRRKVDVPFCFWFNSKPYQDSQDEYYRGVYLYNFTESKKGLDYPFAHIHNVNKKGDRTNDGSRRGIRLLKTLKDDGDIKLSSFQITSIVHSISDDELRYSHGQEAAIAQSMSGRIGVLLDNSSLRKELKSPNGNEYPLVDESVTQPLKSLKIDLDELILDCKKELRFNYIEKGLKSYV